MDTTVSYIAQPQADFHFTQMAFRILVIRHHYPPSHPRFPPRRIRHPTIHHVRINILYLLAYNLHMGHPHHHRTASMQLRTARGCICVSRLSVEKRDVNLVAAQDPEDGGPFRRLRPRLIRRVRRLVGLMNEEIDGFPNIARLLVGTTETSHHGRSLWAIDHPSGSFPLGVWVQRPAFGYGTCHVRVGAEDQKEVVTVDLDLGGKPLKGAGTIYEVRSCRLDRLHV
ncbi:hypothetical protein EDC01DRAFT_730889 [Geopyxis carbonaria]|nr:hypothetical protein EDC01DRAFT_730889 [Geopyxis carbonaria]